MQTCRVREGESSQNKASCGIQFPKRQRAGHALVQGKRSEDLPIHTCMQDAQQVSSSHRIN